MHGLDNTAHAGDTIGAGIGAGIQEGLHPSGHYHVQHHDADGQLLWEDDIGNLVTTAGKNFALDTLLSGSSYTAAWYLGLVDGATAPTYAAADTMASHAGWTENVGYSNANRPAPAFSGASAGSKATSAAVVFNVNAGGTIAGVFLVSNSAKSGATGTLYSVGSFSGGDQPVTNGGTLSVTYSASLT